MCKQQLTTRMNKSAWEIIGAGSFLLLLAAIVLTAAFAWARHWRVEGTGSIIITAAAAVNTTAIGVFMCSSTRAHAKEKEGATHILLLWLLVVLTVVVLPQMFKYLRRSS